MSLITVQLFLEYSNKNMTKQKQFLIAQSHIKPKTYSNTYVLN